MPASGCPFFLGPGKEEERINDLSALKDGKHDMMGVEKGVE